MRKLNIRENGRASRSKSATESVTVVILSEAKDLNQGVRNFLFIEHATVLLVLFAFTEELITDY